VGDVVLIKNETPAGVELQKGKVVEAIPSKDGHIKSVEVKYKNPSEKVFRRTLRPIQKVEVFVPVGYWFEEDKSETTVPELAAKCQEKA
jgi:hypothetical protein